MGSFSSCGDELGQWRAYADNGRGYALGFDTKVLESAFARDSDNSRYNNITFPVTYDDAQLTGIHHKFIEMIFPLIILPSGTDWLRSPSFISRPTPVLVYSSFDSSPNYWRKT